MIYYDFSRRNVSYTLLLTSTLHSVRDYFVNKHELAGLIFLKLIQIYPGLQHVQDPQLAAVLGRTLETIRQLWQANGPFKNLGRELIRVSRNALVLKEFQFLLTDLQKPQEESL